MKKKLVILGLVLVVFALILIMPSPKSTVSSGTTYTRKELQDYLVSTAVSYYYNNNYTDYDGYWADESHSEYSTMYNLSPEMISRSRFMTTQCEAFATTCYMHAFNFDFVKYRSSFPNGKYTSYVQSTSGNLKRVYASSDDNAFKNAYKYFNKVYSVDYMNKIARENLSDPMVVLTYQKGKVSTIDGVTDTSKNVTELLTGPNGDAILKKIVDKLQPGDVLLNDGHALVWVGDIFEPSGGAIHSTAVTSSMKRDKNDDKIITEYKNGYDVFDVRYSSLDYVIKKSIIYHGAKTNDDITILRPINSMCTFNNDICTLDSRYASVVSNAIARSKLKNLRVEQFIYDKTGGRTIGADAASVNNGDEITYYIYLTNKSSFSFCSSGKKSNKADCEASGICSNATYTTKETCEKNNHTWIVSQWRTVSKNVSYNNITITANVPSNTKYVSCSGGCKESNGKVTFSNISMPATSTSEKKLGFTVKILDGASSVNFSGMKLSYDGSTLQMGSYKTPINSSVNGKYATEFKKIIDNDINNNVTYNTSLEFVLDTYKKFLNTNNDPSKPVHSDVKTDLASIITADNIINSVFKEINFENVVSYTKKPSGETNALTGNYKILNQMLVPGFWGGYRFNKLYYNSNMSYHNKIKPMWSTRINLNVGDIIVSLDKNKTTNKFSIKNIMMYDGMQDSTPTFAYVENKKVIRHKYRSFPSSDPRSKYSANWYGNSVLIYEMYSSDLYVVLRPSMYYKLQYNVAATGVKLDQTSLSLGEGETSTLKVTISPTNTTNKDLTWSSSDNNVATVTNGKINAIKEGTSTITVKTSNGKTATCKVTVLKKEVAPTVVAVTSVVLDKTSARINEGETLALKATINPSDATNKNLTWSSSNNSIATVTDGTVKAIKQGTVTITVTGGNNKTATCKVTVLSKPKEGTKPIETETVEPIDEPEPLIPVKPPIETNELEKDDSPTENIEQEEIIEDSQKATLADVAIKDIKVDFDKEVYDYVIKTDKDSLEFNIALDNETDTYKIVDNENLSDGSVVKVIVTSIDGEEKEYRFKIVNNKKYYVFGVMGGLAVIITIIVLVIMRKNKAVFDTIS